jgi:hypothetical protein
MCIGANRALPVRQIEFAGDECHIRAKVHVNLKLAGVRDWAKEGAFTATKTPIRGKHFVEIGDLSNIPTTDVLVKLMRMVKHFSHA